MNLREMREQTGRSQKDVAKYVGVQQVTVSNWERGGSSPEPQYVELLARLYAVAQEDVIAAVEAAEGAYAATRDARLADVIRTRRAHAGLTQTAFAEAVGVTNGSVGFWESGVNRPFPETLASIAATFGVEAEDLLAEAGYDQDEMDQFLAVDVEDPSPIALLLKTGRLGAGLTQIQVGAALGVSQNEISALETGVHLPNDDLLDGMVRLYQLDPIDADAAMYAARTAAGHVPHATLPLPLDPYRLSRHQFVVQIRGHRGDRRKELADWLGIPSDHVARLEDEEADGLPSSVCQLDVLHRLAGAAQCDPINLVRAYEPEAATVSDEALLARERELPHVAFDVAELLTVVTMRGITLQDVGDAVGVSREAVRQWKSGRSKPRRHKVGAIAGVLPGTSPAELEALWDRAYDSGSTADDSFTVDPELPVAPWE